MSPLAALLVLLLTPGTPLLVALALAVKPGSRALLTAAPWTALPGLVISWLMPSGIAATVPWVLAGSEFGLEDTGRAFLFASAAIWLAAGLAARSLVTERAGRFFLWFLLVMSGSLGVAVARDMLSFYLFFSLMSFAAYGLVVHDRSQRARYAGRIYITFVLAADMMIFAALVFIAQDSAGDLRFEVVRSVMPEATYGGFAMTLLVLGFGVKLGVLGMHVTLPLIYAAAPVPAGVVLAGAMLNAGLLGWLRLMPVGLGMLPAWGRTLIVLGVAAAFYGALIGCLQRRAAAVLAYSSISQMGIITMAVGVGLTVNDGRGLVLGAVVLYALHHAFAKSALFLGTGIAARTGARHRRLVGLGLLLPAVALTGAPLTSGMLAKETLKEALKEAPSGWHGGLEALLPWMAFATTVVLGRFVWLAWPRSRAAPVPVRATPAAAWLALLLLTASAAWLMPVARPTGLWSAAVLWEVSWPVLLGVLCCAAAVWAGRRGGWTARLVVPPGDVLVVQVALANAALDFWKAGVERLAPAIGNAVRRAVGALVNRPPWTEAIATAERWLVEWPAAVTLLVLVILALWVLLAAG